MEEYLDPYLLEKIKSELNGYQCIACYGTGKKAEKIIPYLKEAGLYEYILSFVDQDDSEMIGREFHGFKVRRYDEIYDKVEVIVITSSLWWPEIKKRLESYEDTYKQHVPVVAIFDKSSQKKRNFSGQDYEEYVEFVKNRRRSGDSFVPISSTPYERYASDAKIIAFYLPQYYRIESNDIYHGAGFTEWTNSSQATPLFCGHNQPHIPYDVGYYSLTTPDVMLRQVDLARRYGVYGFCFHYYWFSGHRTMEKPLKMLLDNPEIDIPFCFNWATENWTQKWDGGKSGVIYQHRFQPEDPVNFMKDILPFFNDKRYIRINGRPVLIIYTLEVFDPDYARNMIETFRKTARENGFPDLYILLSTFQPYREETIEDFNLDGAVEFPPSGMNLDCKTILPAGYINPDFYGTVFDLKEYVNKRKYIHEYGTKNVFRSALVSFDNTARKSKWDGVVFHGASPDVYGKWLQDILEINRKEKREEDNNIVFVNAWNEWAEGCHLEPDMFYGYGYLEATRDAIYRARGLNTEYISKQVEEILKQGVGKVHFYVLCTESRSKVIACEPIPRYLKKHYKGCMVSWCLINEYKEFVKYNPHVDEVLTRENLMELEQMLSGIAEKSKEAVIVDCCYNGYTMENSAVVHENVINPQITAHNFLQYGSLLESASAVAGIPKIKAEPVFYLCPETDNPFAGERYVVLYSKPDGAEKEWQYAKWKTLAENICKSGIKVIEIGDVARVWTEHEYYIDYTGDKSIQVIAQIINGSLAFVGGDNEYAHIANAMHKASVILYGKQKENEALPYSGFFENNRDDVFLFHKNGVKGITSEMVITNLKRQSVL